LRIPAKVDAGDVVMVAELGAAEAAEILLGHIRASAVEAVGVLMVDPLHIEVGMQAVPRAGFIGIRDCAFRDARWNQGRALRSGAT
jgi:hypothetical protein